MSRLPDEQWAMIEDSIEKKNIAHSASHRRTHCGKRGGVALPSDFMSKKELNAMNGNVMTFNLKQPMSWEKFKNMPDDVKVEYVKMIRDKFKTPDKILAKCMGISYMYFGKCLRNLGLGQGKGAGRANRFWSETKESELFREWWGSDLETVTENVNEIKESDVCLVEMTEDDTETKYASPKSGSLTFDCRADEAMNTIGKILGDRKVHIFIDWQVVED